MYSSFQDKKVNVNGSGISLGHPIGATGVMRLVTLVHEMLRRKSSYGLVTICGGGGLGICAIKEFDFDIKVSVLGHNFG